MLKQKPMTAFLVSWYDPSTDFSGLEHIFGYSAQHAVDLVRQHNAPEGAEVVEVAKVVNNWK